MAGSHTAQEAIWLRRLVLDIGKYGGHSEIPTVSLLADNQGVIALTNPEFQRTKHIDIQYHFVQEQVEEGLLELSYMPTNSIVADIMTKPLPRPKREAHMKSMGLQAMG